MNQEELREKFIFREEPTISNRIRFIMRDPKYSRIDKIEYLAYLFLGLGGIILALLSIVVGLLSNLGIKASLCIGVGILLVLLYIIPIWRKSRTIKERFVDPYRDWVGGEEYAQKAPVLYNQIISESMEHGQDKGGLAFI